MIIEPYDFQKSTAFKERTEIADKVNEVIDVINDNGGTIESTATYTRANVTIRSGTGGITVTGDADAEGIVCGSVGFMLNGTSTRVGFTYYIDTGKIPNTLLCTAITISDVLYLVKATISGTPAEQTIVFSAIGGDTETLLQINSARATILKRI